MELMLSFSIWSWLAQTLIPKYRILSTAHCAGNIPEIEHFNAFGMLNSKKLDLSLLILNPDIAPNFWVTLSISIIDWSGCSKKQMTSSAYRAIFAYCFPARIPLMHWCSWTNVASGSVANANNNRERGQPCRMPRSSMICLESNCIQTENKEPSPLYFSTTPRLYCHSIQSKAFSASRNNNILGTFSACDFLIIFNTVCILFYRCLSWIKPVWSFWTQVFIIVFILFPSRVARIL